MTHDKRIHLGTVMAAHGLKGDVKVKSFCDVPEDIAAYGPLQDAAGNVLDARALSSVKDVVQLRIAQITTREAAEALARAKTKLYVPREQLPDDEEGGLYYEDFKGLKAVADGKQVGVVSAMVDYGAGDTLVIEGETGEFMLPYKEPFAAEPDFEKGTINVLVPEGWLPEKKSKKGSGEKKDD